MYLAALQRCWTCCLQSEHPDPPQPSGMDHLLVGSLGNVSELPGPPGCSSDWSRVSQGLVGSCREAPGPGLWQVGLRGCACAPQSSFSPHDEACAASPTITRVLSWAVFPLKGRFESPSGVCVLGQPDWGTPGTPGSPRPLGFWPWAWPEPFHSSSIQEAPAGAGASPGAAHGPMHRADTPPPHLRSPD